MKPSTPRSIMLNNDPTAAVDQPSSSALALPVSSAISTEHVTLTHQAPLTPRTISSDITLGANSPPPVSALPLQLSGPIAAPAMFTTHVLPLRHPPTIPILSPSGTQLDPSSPLSNTSDSFQFSAQAPSALDFDPLSSMRGPPRSLSDPSTLPHSTDSSDLPGALQDHTQVDSSSGLESTRSAPLIRPREFDTPSPSPQRRHLSSENSLPSRIIQLPSPTLDYLNLRFTSLSPLRTCLRTWTPPRTSAHTALSDTLFQLYPGEPWPHNTPTATDFRSSMMDLLASQRSTSHTVSLVEDIVAPCLHLHFMLHLPQYSLQPLGSACFPSYRLAIDTIIQQLYRVDGTLTPRLPTTWTPAEGQLFSLLHRRAILSLSTDLIFNDNSNSLLSIRCWYPPYTPPEVTILAFHTAYSSLHWGISLLYFLRSTYCNLPSFDEALFYACGDFLRAAQTPSLAYFSCASSLYMSWNSRDLFGSINLVLEDNPVFNTVLSSLTLPHQQLDPSLISSLSLLRARYNHLLLDTSAGPHPLSGHRTAIGIRPGHLIAVLDHSDPTLFICHLYLFMRFIHQSCLQAPSLPPTLLPFFHCHHQLYQHFLATYPSLRNGISIDLHFVYNSTDIESELQGIIHTAVTFYRYLLNSYYSQHPTLTWPTFVQHLIRLTSLFPNSHDAVATLPTLHSRPLPHPRPTDRTWFPQPLRTGIIQRVLPGGLTHQYNASTDTQRQSPSPRHTIPRHVN